MLNKQCVSEKMTSPIAQGIGGLNAFLKGVTLSCLYEDNMSCYFIQTYMFPIFFSTFRNYLYQKSCVYGI